MPERFPVKKRTTKRLDKERVKEQPKKGGVGRTIQAKIY